VGAELLELLLLRGASGLPGAAARVDDARVEPDLNRVVGRAARAAEAHDRTGRSPLHAERDKQQGQRRGQAAHDDRDTAQTQELPAGRSHGPSSPPATHPGGLSSTIGSAGAALT